MDHPTGTNREQRRAQTRDRRRRAAGAALTASSAALGATALLLAGGAAPAGADTFTVTTVADSGAGSLRQAILDANNHAGADVISFAPNVTGTITLESGLPHIDEDVDIQGPGASVVTVDGNGFYAFVFDATNSTISGLTVTGADATNNGFDNGSGGGIANYAGTVSITGMVLSGNHANNDGGGAWCENGDSQTRPTLTVTDSVISGNSVGQAGGGIYAWDCDVTVVNTTVSGNTADQKGGGLYLGGDSTAVVRNSTISKNTAGESGGGINASSYSLTVTNSTISGNTTSGEGGGIYAHYSSVTLDQDTIVQNTATTFGGVSMGRSENVGSVKTQSEQARAHAKAAGGPNQVESSGTIIALNSGTDVGNIGEITATGSIIGSIDPGTTYTDKGGNQLAVDPLLGPLANNGGPTQTHALLAGSAAIDKGPNPVASFPLNDNDQRGSGFPRVVNGQVDVGAFEVQPVQPVTPPVEIAPKFTG
jgi:parallel beta-helix repeat protein